MSCPRCPERNFRYFMYLHYRKRRAAFISFPLQQTMRCCQPQGLSLRTSLVPCARLLEGMDTVFPVSWETGSEADQGPLQTLWPELKDLSTFRAVAAPSGLAPHRLRCKYLHFLKDATVHCLTLASEVWGDCGLGGFFLFFYPTTSPLEN